MLWGKVFNHQCDLFQTVFFFFIISYNFEMIAYLSCWEGVKIKELIICTVSVMQTFKRSHFNSNQVYSRPAGLTLHHYKDSRQLSNFKQVVSGRGKKGGGVKIMSQLRVKTDSTGEKNEYDKTTNEMEWQLVYPSPRCWDWGLLHN